MPQGPTRETPNILLQDIPAMTAALWEKIRASGFQPELILYVERGARLPAEELARLSGLHTRGIEIRRSGSGLKDQLQPITRLLGPAWTARFRRWEEVLGLHKILGRKATVPGDLDLRTKRVLILDDATDTGGTLRTALRVAEAAGALPEDVRFAVLTATTEEARELVLAFISPHNSRFPWSPDSPEYESFLEFARRRWGKW